MGQRPKPQITQQAACKLKDLEHSYSTPHKPFCLSLLMQGGVGEWGGGFLPEEPA